VSAILLGAVKLLLPGVLDKTFGTFERLFSQHQQNQITREQLLNDMGKALLDGFTEQAKVQADAVKATFASFMTTVQTVPLVARAYVAILLSQGGVLIWVQAGIPALMWFFPDSPYPSAGTTIDWGYALVAGLCGLGPLVMKTSPEDLRKLVGKGGVA
jgi:hypothetical protein